MAIEIFKIKRCICGCSLRTGFLIWLWISMIVIIPLIISEVDYLLKGSSSNHPYLYWFHIFQLSSAIVWVFVNILSLSAIYKEKYKLLLPILWSSVLSILSFITVLILLVIFWTEIINSEIINAYLQELLIVEEARLNSTDKRLLYEKIKEIITRVGLPVIESIGGILLVLEIYITTIIYSLYSKMKETERALTRIVTVETKKRRSQILAHSLKEVKPILNIN